MDDALAEEGEDHGCAGYVGGWTAEHECECSCVSSNDSARHGCVNKDSSFVRFIIDEQGDGTGCGWIYSRAVDEEALCWC